MRLLRILIGAINPYYYMYYGRKQQIIDRWVKSGKVKITWIDPPRFFFYNQPIKKSIFESVMFIQGKPIQTPSMQIYKPLTIPYYLKYKLIYIFTEKLLNFYLNNITKILNKKYDIFMVTSPIFLKAAKKLQKYGVKIVYDCRDYFPGFSHVGEYAIKKEKELIEISELIIVPSYTLCKKIISKSNYNKRIVVIPNGVPSSMISPCKPNKKNNNPTIGYIGSIWKDIDFDTIFEVAKEKEEWKFFFVGDTSRVSDIIKNAPENCNFLGKIPYNKVEEMICSFDVCIIPWKINELTNVVFPIKLLEFFGKGKPVVCSPIQEIVENPSLKNLVYLASTKDEWIASIELALKDKNQEKYIEFAKKYTWEKLSEKYLDELYRGIGY